jgi:hypothetical protein
MTDQKELSDSSRVTAWRVAYHNEMSESGRVTVLRVTDQKELSNGIRVTDQKELWRQRSSDSPESDRSEITV